MKAIALLIILCLAILAIIFFSPKHLECIHPPNANTLQERIDCQPL